MRGSLPPIVGTLMLLASLPAFAQGSPSADQIINSLKPTGNLVQGGTRGIRLAAPDAGTPAPAPAATPAAQSPRVASSKPVAVPAAPPPSTGAPSVNLTVNFATGSTELTPDAIRTLNELGRALSSADLAAYKFRIEGHTDTVGSKEYNRALSERRATVVVEYISKKFGVDPSRLQAVGMGVEGLLIQTPDQTPEPRNRRVLVVNVGT